MVNNTVIARRYLAGNVPSDTDMARLLGAAARLPLASRFPIGISRDGVPLAGQPALAAGEWNGHAVYWIGPLLGGLVAALVWSKLLLPKTDRS